MIHIRFPKIRVNKSTKIKVESPKGDEENKRPDTATASVERENKEGGAFYSHKFVIWWLAITLFLFPFFTLPPFWGNLQTNKSILLFGTVLIGYVLWFSSMILHKRMDFVVGLQDVGLALFLVVYFIASIIAAPNKYFLFNFSQSSYVFITLLAIFLLYFLIKNNAKTKTTYKFLLKALIYGGVIGVVESVLFYLNLLKVPVSILGSLSTIGIFSALGTVCALAVASEAGKLQKIIFTIISIIFFIALTAIDFNICWYAFLIVAVGYLIVKFWKFKISTLEFNLLFLFIIVSAAMLFLSAPRLFGYNLPTEIGLSQRGSWDIVKQVVKAHPLLGTGGNSFYYNFSKYRSPVLNNTFAWNIRFRSPASVFWEILNNSGIVGIILWLVTLLLFGFSAFKQIRKEKDVIGVSVGILALSLCILSFLSDFSLMILVITALFLAFAASKRGYAFEAPFAQSSKFKLVNNALLMTAVLIMLVSGYFVGRVYLGDVAYAQALRETMRQGNVNLTHFEKNIQKAIYWNPYQENYYLSYVSVVFNEAQAESQKKRPNTQRYQNLLAKAINRGAQVIKLDPNNATLLDSVGNLYTQLFYIASNAPQFAFNAYKKAISLDPTNPVLYENFGLSQVKKIGLLKAVLAQQKKTLSQSDYQKLEKNVNGQISSLLKKAIANFKKSIALKSDYLPPHYSLAQVYEQEDKLDDALKELDKALAINRYNVDVLFEKGKILLNQNKLDAAAQEFKKALAIFPNHSNSLYSLGIVLEKQGKKKEALEKFERVGKLNPGNKDVERKINALRASLGMSTETGGKKEDYALRNTQREKIIEEIASVLENYANDHNGMYPKSAEAYLDKENTSVMRKLIAGGYVSHTFKDPLGTKYHFIYKSNGSNYEIDYVQETSDGKFTTKTYKP